MNDEKLLKLAAKAAQVEGEWDEQDGGWNIPNDEDGWFSVVRWDPLKNDSQALRLAVKLRLDLTFHRPQVYSHKAQPSVFLGEYYKDNPYAATRRAIVRAAAEIGKGMK